MVETTTFKLGEKRNVTILVDSISNSPFEVSSASFELKNGETVEASGDCEIRQLCEDSVLISALIQPMIKCALYDLEFTYTIYPETMKHICRVRVV